MQEFSSNLKTSNVFQTLSIDQILHTQNVSYTRYILVSVSGKSFSHRNAPYVHQGKNSRRVWCPQEAPRQLASSQLNLYYTNYILVSVSCESFSHDNAPYIIQNANSSNLKSSTNNADTPHGAFSLHQMCLAHTHTHTHTHALHFVICILWKFFTRKMHPTYTTAKILVEFGVLKKRTDNLKHSLMGYIFTFKLCLTHTTFWYLYRVKVFHRKIHPTYTKEKFSSSLGSLKGAPTITNISHGANFHTRNVFYTHHLLLS